VSAYDALAAAGGVVVLGLLFLAETRAPLRGRVRPRGERLAVNGAVAVLAMLVVRLAVVPVGIVVASAAQRHRFGVLHWVGAPPVAAWVVGVLLLDYTMYVWHRLNHRVPLLWRFHLVHHTDLDLDVATALRFHVGELLLSCGWRAAHMAAIGPPVALVLVFEMVFEAATAFHHSNWRLPEGRRTVTRSVCARSSRCHSGGSAPRGRRRCRSVAAYLASAFFRQSSQGRTIVPPTDASARRASSSSRYVTGPPSAMACACRRALTSV
jgi:sterol desaturase/sphingolipid hydroxylase (fatty acid hydroxylase superfamily)